LWVVLVILVAVAALAVAVLGRAVVSGTFWPVAGATTQLNRVEVPNVEGGGDDDYPYLHKDLPSSDKMFKALRTCKITASEVDGVQVVTRLWPKDLYASDALTSHFSETVRIRCRFGKGKWGKPSFHDVWHNPDTRRQIEQKATKFDKITKSEALREAMYDYAFGCNFYNPAFCLWVYRALAKLLKTGPDKIRILDPSAGWGDRLVAACAFGADQYHGYDPNSELREPYDTILEKFGPRKAGRYSVTTGRFEAATVPAESYDIVHTSPPFFDLEDYPAEGGNTARQHPVYQDWLNDFYEPYLKKAWNALRPGGYYCLYIDDMKDAPMAQDSKRFLDSLGAQYVTQYGFRQKLDWPELGGAQPKTKAPRPAFVWLKPAVTQPRSARANARRASDNIVVDTLNLTHHLCEGASGKFSCEPFNDAIEFAIRHATPVIRAQHTGRIYFVLKDPDRDAASSSAQLQALAKELDVYIHVAEKYKDSASWQSLGEAGPTHQKQGRDDFYMGYLAWKMNCAVLTEDRMRDFEKLKSEVRPFHVRAFDSWRPSQVTHLFPGAHEYAKIRAPAAVRYAEYDL